MIWFMNIWDVFLFTVIIIVTSFFYGYFLRSFLFDKIIDFKCFLPAEVFFLTAILGHLGILLFMIVISLFKIISLLPIVAMTILMAIYMVVRFYVSGMKFSSLVNHLRDYRLLSMFFVFLIFGIFYYFGPVFVKHIVNYPGGDDKAYLFTTVHVLRNKGFSFDFSYYPYALFHGHIFASGFSLFAIFFLNILSMFSCNISIPTIHLFLILYFRALTPISFYLFAKKFTENVKFSASLAIAGIFLCHTFMLFFRWGGVGESLGYFLVPLLLILDFDLTVKAMGREGFWLVFIASFALKLVFVAVLLFCHIYSVIFFVFLATIIELCYIQKNVRRRILFAFQYVIMYLVSSVLVIVILPFLSEGLRTSLLGLLAWDANAILNNDHQKLWSHPYLVFSKDLTVMSFFIRFAAVFIDYFGWYSLPIILFDAIILMCKDEMLMVSEEIGRFVKAVTLTFVCLFLFSQNNPFGLYYVPYVGAIQVYVVRLYHPMELLTLVYKGLFIFSGISLVSSIRFKRNSLKKLNYREKGYLIAAWVILILTVLGLIVGRFTVLKVPSYKFYYDVYMNAANESVITSYDIYAFEWIKEHVPEDAIFYVNPSDAGPFIYIVTGRLVLPPYSLRIWTDKNASKNFFFILNNLVKGNISVELVQKLVDFNVSFIYVGAKTQYGDLKFNVTALELSSFFTEVFSYGPVKIFRLNHV